ncbi:NAD(P)/FAD-dependent oxidoreductase [Actinomadura macrotermitis]|uniref:Demethylphylloquinone reductase NdbB n=1 Tax=Actinomadura macrotermitis TaxID=2585200 RepID=A0A7K0C3B2_9ACTN|nr:NAD(P)/FAD-dependent oxidoreductase [Actinomadura macrotermitis]MQY07939.1 Demethylphylloquinone reductase NdbB [Actinomadura macrotermitis]
MKRIVVVGAGFGGFHLLRTLQRRLPRGAAELVLVNPKNYHLYTPLLPHVAGGRVHPASVAVPLRTLKHTRFVRGSVTDVDLTGKKVTVRDPRDRDSELSWDRLVLAPGAVTRIFDIPGLKEHAHGFKTITEAVYLVDRVLANLDMAATTRDPAEREALTTFIVVGAGLAGAEYIAQARRLADAAAPRTRTRWILLDMADSVMPQLGGDLPAKALKALRAQGIEVRLGMSVQEVTADSATLTDGTKVPCRMLVWTAGVSASPLIEGLGLPTERGRLVVTAEMAVPGHPGVFALGDAAAVPDLTGGDGALCGQTAQHAMRQGPALARNVAASLGHGEARPYRHHDLGMVADLGGLKGVASPLHVPLTGAPAKAVASAYHLMSLESLSNQVRLASDWIMHAVTRPAPISFGLVPGSHAALTAVEQLGIYPAADAHSDGSAKRGKSEKATASSGGARSHRPT